MKACEACHVGVETEASFCPLCGTQLEDAPPPVPDAPRNLYPDFSGRVAKYNFVGRLLVFFSVFGCVASVPINLLTTPHFLWCLIVIAATAYCWLTVPPLLRRGKNFGRQVVMQSTLTIALAVAIDAVVGWRGWSLSYVVPSLLSAGTLAIVLMIVFNRTNWAQYVLYQVLMGVFGLIPMVLFLLGLAQNVVLVLISTGISLASLLATIIFADRTIKSEFKRRFHF